MGFDKEAVRARLAGPQPWCEAEDNVRRVFERNSKMLAGMYDTTDIEIILAMLSLYRADIAAALERIEELEREIDGYRIALGNISRLARDKWARRYAREALEPLDEGPGDPPIALAANESVATPQPAPAEPKQSDELAQVLCPRCGGYRWYPYGYCYDCEIFIRPPWLALGEAAYVHTDALREAQASVALDKGDYGTQSIEPAAKEGTGDGG